MDKLKLIEAVLASDCGASNAHNLPFEIGEKLFIRTVTHHLIGKLVKITGRFLTLSDAAWIADDGRFMDAINDGKLNEVEPVNCDVRVNSDTIIDAYAWTHDLPRGQK